MAMVVEIDQFLGSTGQTVQRIGEIQAMVEHFSKKKSRWIKMCAEKFLSSKSKKVFIIKIKKGDEQRSRKSENVTEKYKG